MHAHTPNEIIFQQESSLVKDERCEQNEFARFLRKSLNDEAKVRPQTLFHKKFAPRVTAKRRKNKKINVFDGDTNKKGCGKKYILTTKPKMQPQTLYHKTKPKSEKGVFVVTEDCGKMFTKGVFGITKDCGKMRVVQICIWTTS